MGTDMFLHSLPKKDRYMSLYNKAHLRSGGYRCSFALCVFAQQFAAICSEVPAARRASVAQRVLCCSCLRASACVASRLTALTRCNLFQPSRGTAGTGCVDALSESPSDGARIMLPLHLLRCLASRTIKYCWCFDE